MATSDSTKSAASQATTTDRSRGQSTNKPRQSRKPRGPRLTQKVLDEKAGTILMESVLSQLAEPQEFGKQLGKGIAQGVAEEAKSIHKQTMESKMDPNTINAGETITQEQATQINDLCNRPTGKNKWITVTVSALATLGLGLFVGSRGKKQLRAENAAFRSGDVSPMGIPANG